MSDDWEDSPWAEHHREVDEEIARQHSRELNEQIGREHSAELDKQRAADEPWPPEGTRVRIRDGSEAHGDEGELALYGEVWMVELENGCIWPVLQRHEIEVIDE